MRRIDKLTHHQKMEIYNKYHTGFYYVKEIEKEYGLNYRDVIAIVKEIEELLENELYGTN